jgi:hypothetical protein
MSESMVNVVSLDDEPVMSRPMWALFEAGAVLLADNSDLPAPIGLGSVYDSGALSFQFAPEQSSVDALVAWAQRFGGAMNAKTVTREGRSELWVKVCFPFGGVETEMYAHIPKRDQR